MNSVKKIMVGMSGGVDSSVTAALLKEQGHDISALFMKNWEEDDVERCNSKDDYEDAKRICKKLGIKLHTVNFSDKYWDLVFKRFLEDLKQGFTPNPDIYCNKEIKFNYFLKYALSLGFDKVATGHYAKLIKENNCITLNKPKDKLKDQTYFLYMLNQNILNKIIFPLEEVTKQDVKMIAKNLDITIYEKKESMGICFIGKRNFSNFIKKYINNTPGDICNEDNIILGKHDGLFNYTLGQRKGIKIGGHKDFDEKPWFVIRKDSSNNKLIISQNEDELMYKGIIELDVVSWINEKPIRENYTCEARFRHGGRLIPVKIMNDKYKIELCEKERAVTPGQSAVFYSGEKCLGGGIIRKLCSKEV